MKPRVSGRLATKLAFFSLLLVAANMSLCVIGIQAQESFYPGFEVQSVAVFYGPLTSYGTWYNLPAYGRCWHPVGVESLWRPYSVGHWEWTDYRWYWMSDEPWAWACYHYGSWVYDPVYGWIWVPGAEWAPAWVVWRESPDFNYIGWAPCGPSGVVVSPSLFVFVGTRHFRDHLRPHRLIVNNTTLVARTREINNIAQETRNFGGRTRRITTNRGPGVDPIQRIAGTRIEPRPIQQVMAQTHAPEQLHPSHLAVASEERNARQQAVPPPVSRPEQQPHIYRQPAVQPPPTGREEPRIYHEPQAPVARPQSPPAAIQPPTVTRKPGPGASPFIPQRTPPPQPERGAEHFQRESAVPNSPPQTARETLTRQPVPPPPQQGRGGERDRERGPE